MKRAYFKYIFSLLLFGSNGIVASYIALSSYEIVFFRTLIGSLLLISVFIFSRREVSFKKYKKHTFFVVLSGIAMGLSWMFVYEAYKQIGVSIASLVFYCGPIIVMIVSPILFKEKLTLPKILGFITVFCGVFLVNGQISHGGNIKFGLFCGTMAALMYSLMIIFNKQAKDIVGLENSTIQLVAGFVVVAVFIGIKQRFVIDVPASSWIPIFILGSVNTAIGCYLYFSSICELPVQTVAVCGYLEPLSAVVFSVLILGEVMSLPQIIGAVMIICGAIFVECCDLLFAKNRKIILK
ncbi:MAG: EamA family transporter [Intestinibacter sp.]|uniref:DMT family transporter n=1 Tax=Intestinibacter sp. TaxID=1965304 RepID=UPI0025C25834|nr:EamA family transporter [Intestinibacter sp.]MCI6738086.1 EamA family transporter [Intestinibacter sp.]